MLTPPDTLGLLVVVIIVLVVVPVITVVREEVRADFLCIADKSNPCSPVFFCYPMDSKQVY